MQESKCQNKLNVGFEKEDSKMTKNELESLAEKIVPFIRASPHCSTCGKDRTQMCGRCFGNIKHKLPLTPEQNLKIRDIEYEARRQIHKKRIFLNSLNVIGFIVFWSGPLLYGKYFMGKIASVPLGFLEILLLIIIHIFSYFLLFLAFGQAVTLFLLKKQIKYNRTLEDENYYGG